MRKILIAGLLGGLVNFAWGAVFHMFLPLGTAGMSRLPNEDDALEAIRENVRGPGLYVFPWMEDPGDASKERKEAIEKEWTEKYRRGPSGLMVLLPRDQDPMRPTQLLTEFASNVVCALVAAALLGQAVKAGTGYPGCVVLCALLGFFASVSIDVSYWNWRGFPTDFLKGALVEQTVGWGLAGLAIGAILRRSPARAYAPAPVP